MPNFIAPRLEAIGSADAIHCLTRVLSAQPVQGIYIQWALERLAEETRTLPALLPQEADSISYLIGVARGKFEPRGLSSLENNMIVIEILDAARESARTGRTITLGSSAPRP